MKEACSIDFSFTLNAKWIGWVNSHGNTHWLCVTNKQGQLEQCALIKHFLSHNSVKSFSGYVLWRCKRFKYWKHSNWIEKFVHLKTIMVWYQWHGFSLVLIPNSTSMCCAYNSSEKANVIITEHRMFWVCREVFFYFLWWQDKGETRNF